MFELHVYPPAFSLPSVDPECLTAIAYMAQAIPTTLWILIPSEDGGASIGATLPALLTPKDLVSGFTAIKRHLSEISSGLWTLDSDITLEQVVDLEAFTSHIHLHLRPLVLHSLHSTPENYTKITRPALTAPLRFPQTFLLPPLLHARALAQITHLPTTPSPSTLRPAFPAFSSTPSRPSALASTPAIRLASHTATALEPLAALLDSNKPGMVSFLIGTSVPTSLDCLALGYLTLAIFAPMPDPWLEQAIQRFPSLVEYTHAGVLRAFAGPVNPYDLQFGVTLDEEGRYQGSGENSARNGSLVLPWYPYQAGRWKTAGGLIKRTAEEWMGADGTSEGAWNLAGGVAAAAVTVVGAVLLSGMISGGTSQGHEAHFKSAGEEWQMADGLHDGQVPVVELALE